MKAFWGKLLQSLPEPWQGEIQSMEPVGGGDINEAYRININNRFCFVKLNHASKLDMFKAEAAALSLIMNSNTIMVPTVIGFGELETKAYLALEWMDMKSSGSWEEMGKQLAKMHKVTQSKHGWSLDNTIGSTRQINTETENWVDFYRDYRLKPQYQWAKEKGLNVSGSEALLQNCEAFFEDYVPQASLLHGDLWSGNASFLIDGSPVIYDPASYFGDRETDLAMTELFSGFPPMFYECYHDEFPLNDAYPLRKNLYNLYHILNHYNLFGGSYGANAMSMTRQLLSEIR